MTEAAPRSRGLAARAAAAALAAALALLVAIPAGAQGTLGVRIREAALDPDGAVRLVVSVTGEAADRTLSEGAFSVFEQERRIPDITVRPLITSRVVPVAVVLAIDVSGSTAGRPIADAKTAARSFVARLPQGVRVAVIAFGRTAEVRQPLTTDKARVARTISGLQAGGDTALYDAVVLSASLLNRTAAQRNIVLFSDGADTVSRATLAQAVAAATGARAPVTSVGLVTQDFDEASLTRLAERTRGGILRVSDSAALSSAFVRVAREIASQYVVTYRSTALEPRELDLSVSVSVGGGSQRDSIVVLNPRTAAAIAPPRTGPSIVEPRGPLLSFFGNRTGWYVGIGAGFVALLLLAAMLLSGPAQGQARRALRRGVGFYGAGKRRREQDPAEGLQAIGRRAVQLMERAPRSASYEARLQEMLERAGWPLRATELITIQAAGLVAGAVVGLLLSNWLLALGLAAAGALLPRLILAQRLSARQSAFLAQLPDALQLLAGSLQAGYGFMQALDTLVKEAHTPTSVEFGRVLTEARLGMPVDEALNAMADRMGSVDFRWVVMAINIQRQVGGNLAELLSTVSNTLREREQVRRQIKVLSAEGRLSAVILTVLPFSIAGYILLVNPGYLDPLFDETFGRVMVGVGVALIFVGIAWMRKIIRIDV